MKFDSKPLLSALLALSIFGCSSTTKDGGSNTAPSNVAIEEVATTAEPAPLPTLPAKFIENKSINERSIANFAQRHYDSISVREYQLREHYLHQVEFSGDVLFKFNQSNLDLIDTSEIGVFAQAYLAQGTQKYVYIVGHTDSRGSREYNQSLSVKRSVAIADLMVTAGIPSQQIKVIPAGEILPAYSNKSDAGRAANRRVEVLLAESRELIKAFLREQDCRDIDAACSQTMLPIYDLRKYTDGIGVRAESTNNVVTQTPEMNQLDMLAKSLSKSIQKTDINFNKTSEQRRLSKLGNRSRNVLNIQIDVRNTLVYETDVRPPLLLSDKYLYQTNNGI